MRKEISDVLLDAGKALLANGWIQGMEIAQGHDIHAFYIRRDIAVHVQVYPGLSSREKMMVSGRRMDYRKMLELRASGTSVGNEHGAATNTNHLQQEFPYHAPSLRDLVESMLF